MDRWQASGSGRLGVPGSGVADPSGPIEVALAHGAKVSLAATGAKRRASAWARSSAPTRKPAASASVRGKLLSVGCRVTGPFRSSRSLSDEFAVLVADFVD